MKIIVSCSFSDACIKLELTVELTVCLMPTTYSSLCLHLERDGWVFRKQLRFWLGDPNPVFYSILFIRYDQWNITNAANSDDECLVHWCLFVLLPLRRSADTTIVPFEAHFNDILIIPKWANNVLNKMRRGY